MNRNMLTTYVFPPARVTRTLVMLAFGLKPPAFPIASRSVIRPVNGIEIPEARVEVPTEPKIYTFLLLNSLTWASTDGFRKNTASSLVIAAPACSVLRPLTLTSVRRTKTFPFDPTGTWILS